MTRADETVPSPAVLDACVLVPSMLRNVLLWVATEGVYAPVWSARILAETRRNILALRPDLSPMALDRTISQMNQAFEDAEVHGWERVEPAMGNHPKDRHVLAAAVVGGAAVVVTANLRDFPIEALAPHDVVAMHPDAFLVKALERHPIAVTNSIYRLVEHTGKAGRPKLTPERVLTALEYGGTPAPRFAAAARKHFS